jgi:hypothetical protein
MFSVPNDKIRSKKKYLVIIRSMAFKPGKKLNIAETGI